MIKIYTYSKRINPKTNKENLFYETSLLIQEWEKSFYENCTLKEPNLDKSIDSYIIFDTTLQDWIYQAFNEETKSEETNIQEMAKEEVIEEVAKETKSSKGKKR